jgi:hypothetical protein
LPNDIEAVIETLFQIQDIETIKNNYTDVESIVLSKLKRPLARSTKIDFF